MLLQLWVQLGSRAFLVFRGGAEGAGGLVSLRSSRRFGLNCSEAALLLLRRYDEDDDYSTFTVLRSGLCALGLGARDLGRSFFSAYHTREAIPGVGTAEALLELPGLPGHRISSQYQRPKRRLLPAAHSAVECSLSPTVAP